jgi:hypothetical protein
VNHDGASAIGLVPSHPLAVARPVVRIRLSPGDRPLVRAGEQVSIGDDVVERLRDPRIELGPLTTSIPRPGERVGLPRRPGRARDDRTDAGELLFADDERARVVTGEHVDIVRSPASGTVTAIRTGSELTIEAAGGALPGVLALGVPTHGRVEIATDEAGELRPGSVDVGRSGTILVVGSRVDAETLTRARAMGIRGIVVSGLAAKEERDFGASERRQRAGLHQAPPFGVLVLDGALRRSIAAPVMALLRALEGSDVGISVDPPALVFAGDPPVSADPETIRIRNGPLAGTEGRWGGLAGLRRFPGGVHLEAGHVRLDDGTTHVVPLADLERFV